MKDLIEYLARNLVDAPDEVRVDEVPEGRELVLELRVAPADLVSGQAAPIADVHLAQAGVENRLKSLGMTPSKVPSTENVPT